MARVGSSCVDDDSFQSEFVIVGWELERLFFLLRQLLPFLLRLAFGFGLLLLPRQSFLGVRKHVQFEWELAVVVDFDSHHPIEVELESLQSHEHVPRQLLHAGSFQRVHFLVALRAVVGVVSFEHVALNESLQPLLNAPFVFNGYADG